VAKLPYVGGAQAAADADLDHALRIDKSLLNGPAKWRAVMKARAKIVVSGVAVGINMVHAKRPFPGNRPQDWKRDRMIAADRQRRYASRMNSSKEGSDFGQRPLQLERLFDPSVSQIGYAHEIERRHARCLIDLADERRLAAHLARAMARAWAVGDTTVERYA